jgi:hypothetical protein
MRKKLWLCLPPVVFSITDHIVTLSEQPRAYWAGAYAEAREGAPQGLWLLTLHPLAYVVAAAVYVVFVAVLILALPRLLARVVSVGFALGHAWGISTWVDSDRAGGGYWIILGLFALGAGLIVTSLELADEPPAPTGPPTPSEGGA